jgi:cbb3-type cytochrome oxidase cytochrome c subunit
MIKGTIMPRMRTWIPLGLVLLAGAGLLTRSSAGGQVKREDLRPGLVATYRDAAGTEIVQLDPAVALTLHAGEAPHPRLAGDKFTVRWAGYLNVFRPSEYKFSVLLRGKFRLSIDGKEVLAADAEGDAPAKEGVSVKLPAGAYPLVAEFTRLPGEARLELFWQAPIFIKEPLAIANLKHLPEKAPGQLHDDRLAERGRFLAEELSCVRCHVPGKDDKVGQGLSWRQGPDLSNVGGRYHAGWIYRWLENPRALSHTAVMPRLFTDKETGKVELYAAARYLAGLGGPLKEGPVKGDGNSIKRGEQLFTAVGCAVCHPQELRQKLKPEAPMLHHLMSDSTEPSRIYFLADQARKTTPDKLATFLQDPHKTDPSGRMPSLLLNAKDAQDIANYLCLAKGDKAVEELPPAPAADQVLKAFEKLSFNDAERAAFKKLDAAGQWRALGEQVVVARGCASCHAIEPGGKKLPVRVSKLDFAAIQQPASRGKGCLADAAKDLGTAPEFGFPERRPKQDDDLAALNAFLARGTKGAGSPSPIHEARVALQRFNCLACHNRDGEGGLSEELVLQLRKFQKAEDAETIVPPTLSGIGHKLRTPWFREVLTQGGRSRPWMSLRMPQFGAANVGKLPEAVAALEGTTPDDTVHQVKLTTELLQNGRQLIGKDKGYGCVTCHDIAGIPNSGTRGPDLAVTTQHVRYEWYRRWLESAQRMDPGTKMPSIILDGRTMLDTVLGGNADLQAQAMWAYLSLGPTLPLPEGVGKTVKGYVLTVNDRPSLLRTFLPEAGTRAVAVGFPVGISTAFDATQCRLAYSWAGGFLDAAPVWANRGGAPAKVLGPKFWTAPPGFPWMVGERDSVPDFAAQANDPAFGAATPEGIVFKGEKRLFFDGYRLDEQGVPTFHYRVKADGEHFLKVSERAWPLRALQGLGLERQFKIEVPAKVGALWLYAATVPQADPKRPARVEGGTGGVELKAGEMLAGKHWLVLPQTGDRATVLAVPDLPKGVRWYADRQGDAWKVYLEVEPQGGGPVDLRVRVWSVNRWEAGMLAELLKAK